jgi:hypothetical protein
MSKKSTTIWIVMKGNEEICRRKTKKMAEAVAECIGGWVHKSTKEWAE